VFHAIDPNDALFAHNIKINCGRITAVSAARQAHPEWEGILSPYEAFTRERAKEECFEKVRATSFPSRPPRLGSIFLFPTQAAADQANCAWWGNRRVILPASVVVALRIGTFDARLLDASADQWESAAARYWSGHHTDNPSPEILLDGVVLLKGWEPYGTFFGMLPPAGA
jgi:hypothetical protein